MNLTAAYTGLLMEMISIPAISRKESARADFLSGVVKSGGWHLLRKGNNLLISTGGKPDTARLMLNSHLDTVSPSDRWERDPFEPVFEKGCITGLGSNDAGASVVSMMAAFEKLMKGDKVDKALADRIIMVISAEEEISGSGGISSVLDLMPSLELAIVGEPTGMQPAVAERGLMVVDAVATGTGGHAAVHRGENAIYRAMEDIMNLQKIAFDRPSRWLASPSVSVTMISGGTQHNVVPDRCAFVIDARSNDVYGNEELLGILRENCTAELVPRSLRLRSSSLPADHFAHDIFKDMGLDPFGSSTLSDMALLDFPAVKIGPGDSSRSHSPGEYILSDEIEQAIDTYVILIRKLLKQMS